MSDEDNKPKELNELPDAVASSLAGVMDALSNLKDFLKESGIDVTGDAEEESHEDKH